MANSTITANDTFKDRYHYIFTELADPRTNNWLLVSSPITFVSILAAYLYFVKSLGPRMMKNREPFRLTYVLIVYNFFQVLLSAWMFYESLDGAWLNKYSWKCEPVDFSTGPHAMRIANGVHVFFLAKISELLDTVFFILRKKYNQATFLHLYHHTIMPIGAWVAVKYYPGGHGIFIGFINSFVHMVMYTYYMIAALGPKYQKYLWWKRYITELQLIQFCLGFIHSSQLFFYDCGYPRWAALFFVPNAVFFYYLFNSFYHRAYGTNKTQEKVKSQ